MVPVFALECGSWKCRAPTVLFCCRQRCTGGVACECRGLGAVDAYSECCSEERPPCNLETSCFLIHAAISCCVACRTEDLHGSASEMKWLKQQVIKDAVVDICSSVDDRRSPQVISTNDTESRRASWAQPAGNSRKHLVHNGDGWKPARHSHNSSLTQR